MDEKQKYIVVGVLVLVVAGVGAFEFLGQSGTPAPVAAKAATSQPKTDPAKEVKPVAPNPNPQVAYDLPPRDPFAVPPGEEPAGAKPPIVPGSKGLTPASLPGKIRPFKPLPPAIPGQLPMNPEPTGPSQPTEPPVKPAEEKPFGYKVVGTFGGVKPAVLVEDGSGNQKLVPVGSAIDGDSRVRGVENGAVMIDFRGKKLRLTVGGNPSEK